MSEKEFPFSFIDSHAHLADPVFNDDRTDVLARAREAGASGIVCIGESLAAADRARELAELHEGFVWWTAGVHPHDAAFFDASRDIPALRDALSTGAVAVGECGLDYHYDNSPRDRQIAAFRAQLDLALAANRPVVVHTRDAEPDTAAIVTEAGRSGVTGVLHCYTGSHDLARAALEVGWFISFSGIITFRKWTDDALLRLVPDDRLLVESDAPYLAPAPHRGRRNEPAWVIKVVERLAQTRGTRADLLGAVVSINARTLFALASHA